MESGVAARPLPSIEAYRERMARFAYHSGNSMKPVFDHAHRCPPVPFKLRKLSGARGAINA
jgi:malate dehydrogenase (oxaloacetate-decarboxylating)(NADP+)